MGYPVDTLGVGKPGGPSDEPTIRPSSRSWWWDRWGLSIGGTSYRRGVTVHAPSAMTIDLNRPCVAYDAQVGVDDLVAQGLVRDDRLVKVLGGGELSVALQVTAHAFSASAESKIAAAGGTTTRL